MTTTPSATPSAADSQSTEPFEIPVHDRPAGAPVRANDRLIVGYTQALPPGFLDVDVTPEVQAAMVEQAVTMAVESIGVRARELGRRESGAYFVKVVVEVETLGQDVTG